MTHQLIRRATISIALGMGLLLLVGMHPVHALSTNSQNGTSATSTTATINNQNPTNSSTGNAATTSTSDSSTQNSTPTDTSTTSQAAPSQTDTNQNNVVPPQSTALVSSTSTGNPTPTNQGTVTSGAPSADPQVTNNVSPNSAPTTNTAPTQTQASPTTDQASNVTATDATLNNNVTSTATTGNATVENNSAAGNATTGNASTIANLLNVLGSSLNLSGGQLASFVDNISGDVQGDVTIDPTTLAQLTNQYLQSNNIQATTTGEINNNVSLSATSGNALVDNNGSAGNATSGNAEAEANIINLIDSIVAANQSFLGVVNIYGNLNGNILLPANFLNSTLSSSTSTPTIGNTNTTINNNQIINNQVIEMATTGAATVAANGLAGNATSGNATTKLTLLNLTNDQIVGQNVLLVFVNVLGQWYGLIMNAPAGSTSAALGGGITGNTIIPAVANTYTNTNEIINNNVVVTARSGAATVAYNGSAGNATSGNATTSVNLLNITGSQFSLSNWFGILIINVFGNWNGSLELAPLPQPTINGSISGTATIPTAPSSTVSTGKGHTGYYYGSFGTGNFADSFASALNLQNSGALNLMNTSIFNHHDNNNGKAPLQRTSYNGYIALVGVGIGLALIVIERIINSRQKRATQSITYKDRNE